MRISKCLALWALALLAVPTSVDAQGWKNPVVMSGQQSYDVGDPQVIKYRGVYYLYCSSATKSLLCWTSRDLINWSDAIVVSNDPIAVDGYAPEVKYWNGTFYMVTSPNGLGHYVLTSDSPTGPFKVVTDNLKQEIDGSIFIDDDGQWYFYHAHHTGIKGNKMPTHTSFGTDVDLNACMNHNWTEGPGVFKRNGKYYLIYTGNHVLTNGYRIDYAVNTQGPIARYTPQAEQNPILISADGVDSHYGLGHGSAFVGPDLDSYYFCYHNMTRTSGRTQRQLDLDRIAWNGDKMMMLGNTTWMQDAPIIAPCDYFDRAEIGPDWSTTNGTWSIVNSDYLAQTSSAENAMAVFTPHAEDTFTAEFTMRLAQGETSGRFGALYAYVDANNYQEALLNAAEAKLELYTCNKGVRTLAATCNLVGDFTPQAWHSIRLEKKGTRLKVFVDGLLRTTTTTGEKGGSVGYVSHGCKADFSYIALSPYVDGSGILDVNLPVPGIIPAALCKEQSAGAEREDFALSYGSCEVMHLKQSHWLQYNINVRMKLLYNMGLRYKSSAPAHVRLLAGGVVVKDNVLLPATGNVWSVAPINDIQLTNGRTTLRIEVIDGDVTLYEMLIKRGTATPKTYEDNFDSGISKIWKHTEGLWKAVDGKLRSPLYGKNVAGALSDIGMTDYSVECDLTCTNGLNAGLMFRTNNPSIGGANDNTTLGTDFQQGYFFGISNNAVVLGKQNYGWTTLATKNRAFYVNQSYHLKAVVEGATIKCYIDDDTTPVITYTDPLPFISGRTGVRSHNCIALFDNFKWAPITVSSGIEGVCANGNGATDLADGFDSQSTVTAYTLSGQKVCTDRNATLLLNKLLKGIYVLKDRNGKAKKVIIN